MNYLKAWGHAMLSINMLHPIVRSINVTLQTPHLEYSTVTVRKIARMIKTANNELLINRELAERKFGICISQSILSAFGLWHPHSVQWCLQTMHSVSYETQVQWKWMYRCADVVCCPPSRQLPDDLDLLTMVTGLSTEVPESWQVLRNWCGDDEAGEKRVASVSQSHL